jgi:GTPase SAR1 family protein
MSTADSEVKLTLEGPQGSGKTLLLQAIKTWLSEINIEHKDNDEHSIIVSLRGEDKQFLLTGED